MLLWVVKVDKVKEKGDAGGLPKMLFVVGLGLPMTTNFCFTSWYGCLTLYERYGNPYVCVSLKERLVLEDDH
jgi:hypothetical protein